MSPENNEQHLNHFRNGTQPYKRYALTVLMLVGVIFGAVLLLQAYPSQPLTDPGEAMHTFEDQKPVEVGVDPYNKLIDAKSRDNRKKL